MTTPVTLNLPDDLYEKAQRWASLMQRDVAETLTEALQTVLVDIELQPQFQTPVKDLSDEAVLALTQVQMESDAANRLGELLEKQREETLGENERPELLALMQVYEQLWLRQAEALAEAAKRGLISPLDA
jgi:hypothetical protein